MQVTFIFRMRDISKGKIQVLKKKGGELTRDLHIFVFILLLINYYIFHFFHYAYHWLKNSFCFHLLVVNIYLFWGAGGGGVVWTNNPFDRFFFHHSSIWYFLHHLLIFAHTWTFLLQFVPLFTVC